MTGPAPAVARIRAAVRAELADLDPGELVLAAVSGGRDSMALADALVFEAERARLRAGALIVDHGLQPGSSEVALQVERALRKLGLDPVTVLRVSVGEAGGPEAAARAARYQALDAAASQCHAAAVLLGHTLDDQAETVLLGLGRGSGARSLSGMPRRRDIYRRPLLDIDRATTSAACVVAGLEPWDDPHNLSPAFARIRVRSEVMPVLERELGPGVVPSLARTADQLRDDDAALEAWARTVAEQALAAGHQAEGWDCSVLAQAPAAVRRRVIRRAALAAGVAGHGLRHSQLVAVDALVAKWHGQGPVDLPGGIQAERRYGRLRLVAAIGTKPSSLHGDDLEE